MKNNRYTIPKGYKGISDEIILEFNTNLAVITGLNGSGKSTILKYLYENYPDRSRCFIKIPQKDNFFDNERRSNRIYYSRFRQKEDISFEEIISEIENIGLRNLKINSPFVNKTDFYASLFDEKSIYYEEGYEVLVSITKLLADYQYDEINNIKKVLGVVTEDDIERKLISKLNKNKTQIQTQFNMSTGKNVVKKYKNSELTKEQSWILKKYSDEIEKSLKIEIRKKSKINSEKLLKKYIYDLQTKEFRSIESIVQKMSDRIYQDFKTKNSKTKTKKLWEEINEELEKYCNKGYFKYKLVAPQIFESNYEMAFENFDNTSKSVIHFDSLSSGEKIIFELICYYFASKESKIELIMLDEFDANLNPLLAEQYIEVIKEQFKDIKVVLTTHSPSTVVEVKPNELYELTDSRMLKCANNENGKKEILRRLAPKFVYHGEFGILEEVFNNKYEKIVFLEGKNDVVNFEKGLENEKIKFINSNGVGNMVNLITIFKAIPFFKELAKQKCIVFLFDFDKEGIDNLCKCLSKEQSSQEVYDKIRKKDAYRGQLDDELNIFISHLVPDNSHSWEVQEHYRHQELKKEGERGIKRQLDNLNNIKLMINN